MLFWMFSFVINQFNFDGCICSWTFGFSCCHFDSVTFAWWSKHFGWFQVWVISTQRLLSTIAVKQLWWDWFSSFNLYSTDQVQIFNDCYNDFPRQLIFHLFPRDNFFLFLLINDSHFLPLGILLQAKQKESLFDSLNGWHVWTGYDSLSFWE